MAVIDDVTARLPVVLAPHRLVIDGPARTDPPSDGYQIRLRNSRRVRVVLQLTEELVDDATDGIAVVDLVDRTGVLHMLAHADESRTL